MPTFVATIHADDLWQTFSPEVQADYISRYRDWVRSKGEKVLHANPVANATRWVTKEGIEDIDRTGDPDSYTGYFIFEAEDLEEATAWVQQCPGIAYGGRMQLRTVGH